MSVGRRLQMNARGGKGTRLSFGPQVKAGDMVTVEVDALKKAVRFYRNQARGWSFFHACSLSPQENLAPGTLEGDHVSTPALCRWLYVRHIRAALGRQGYVATSRLRRKTQKVWQAARNEQKNGIFHDSEIARLFLPSRRWCDGANAAVLCRSPAFLRALFRPHVRVVLLHVQRGT